MRIKQIIIHSILGQVKKNWLASFFQKFYGWEKGVFLTRKF